MRVIYYSYSFFADCDFPLVKALQDKGIDVRYYMPLQKNFQHSSILELEKPITKLGLVKASAVKEMAIYRDCINLEKLFFIQGYKNRKFGILSWCLWIYTLAHMKMFKADVIHIDWPFKNRFEKFLFIFALGRKKIMTVHDPIMHSGVKKEAVEELARRRSFEWADRFILLNKIQADEFSQLYKINKNRIFYSRLGMYSSISHVQPLPSKIKGKYVLFFGQINPNKGVEYLIQAMPLVHQDCPDVKLVVAGRGSITIDKEKYQHFEYIEWRNYYIGISELVGLVRESLFVVCPYKDATQSGVVQTAFSLEKPVIATNVGNMPEVVKDGVTGFIVPSCDVQSLANAIIKLYRDPQMISLFTNNIKAYNEKDNCWDDIADDYIRLYKTK